MTIGQLGEKTGLTADTLRYYEKEGLLKPLRKGNGYRDYPEATIEQLLFLKTAQNLGFTLREIRSEMEAVFFREFDFHRVKGHLERQLVNLNLQIGVLEERKKLLVALMENCRHRHENEEAQEA